MGPAELARAAGGKGATDQRPPKMGRRARSSIAAHLSSPLMRSVFLGVLPILLTAGLCGSTPTPPPASPPPWWLVGNGSESTDQYMLVTSLSCAASGCVELSSERCRAASSWVHTVLDPEEMYYYMDVLLYVLLHVLVGSTVPTTINSTVRSGSESVRISLDSHSEPRLSSDNRGLAQNHTEILYMKNLPDGKTFRSSEPDLFFVWARTD